MTQILQISVGVLKDEGEFWLFGAGSFKAPPYLKDGKRPLK